MNFVQNLLIDKLNIWTTADSEKKSGRGRIANGAECVYGIGKLRQLILELAFQGKLLAQDCNDEPASELLKRVQFEKSKLTREEKSKHEKPFSDIRNGEAVVVLPKSWTWVRFGDIAQHNSGKTLDKGRNTGNLREYITTSNLYWGKFELYNVRQMPIRDDELEKCTARKNDLLICEGGEAGRAAVWPYDEEMCFQNHVHRARLFGSINPYYAFRFFEKLNATGEINQYRKGVGISNMSSKALASIPFPLPPLAEQHRIVAKVDELMTLCDQLEARHISAVDAHEKLVSHLLGTLTDSQNAEDFAVLWQRIAAHFDTLFTTEASIDALKQTLLQLAVMGKLVPQDSNDEPAIELIKKLMFKRDAAAKNKFVLEKILGDEKTFPLPPNWAWVRLGSLFEIQRGSSPRPKGDSRYFSRAKTKHHWIKISDISAYTTDDKLVTTEEYLTDEGTKFSRLVTPLDLIVAVSGSVGKVCKLSIDGYIYDGLMAIKNIEDDLLRDYLFLVFKYVEDALLSQATGSAWKNINTELANNMVIAMPPIQEQKRIVNKFQEVIKLCDLVSECIATANRHRQKIADTFVEQALA